MYELKSFADGLALVENKDLLFLSYIRAADEQEAETKVVDFNKAAMIEQLASHRFDVEVAGIELSDGLRVQTDRESQAQLNITYTHLKFGIVPDTAWKGGNGWQLVNLEQIEPIVRAVAAHERGCFLGEKQLLDAINSAVSLADIKNISISAMFDTAYQEAVAEVMAPEQVPE